MSLTLGIGCSYGSSNSPILGAPRIISAPSITYQAEITTILGPEFIKRRPDIDYNHQQLIRDLTVWLKDDSVMMDLHEKTRDGTEYDSFRGGTNGKMMETLDRRNGELTLTKNVKDYFPFFYGMECLLGKPFDFIQDHVDPRRQVPITLNELRSYWQNNLSSLNVSLDKTNNSYVDVITKSKNGYTSNVVLDGEHDFTPIKYTCTNASNQIEAIYKANKLDELGSTGAFYASESQVTLYNPQGWEVRTDYFKIKSISINAISDNSIFTLDPSVATLIWDKDHNLTLKTSANN